MKEHHSEEMLPRRGPSRHSPPLPVAYWLHPTPSCPQRGVSPTACGLGAPARPGGLSIRWTPERLDEARGQDSGKDLMQSGIATLGSPCAFEVQRYQERGR